MKHLIIVLSLVVGSAGLLSMQSLADEPKKDASDRRGPEIKVPLDEFPPAVKKTFLKVANGGEIKNTAKQKTDGVMIYSGQALKDGTETLIVIKEDGKLIMTVATDKNGKTTIKSGEDYPEQNGSEKSGDDKKGKK